MTGWRVILGCTIAALGALAFLTLVAHEIEHSESKLEQREHIARQARQRRRMATAAARPGQARGRRPEENAA